MDYSLWGNVLGLILSVHSIAYGSFITLFAGILVVVLANWGM